MADYRAHNPCGCRFESGSRFQNMAGWRRGSATLLHSEGRKFESCTGHHTFKSHFMWLFYLELFMQKRKSRMSQENKILKEKAVSLRKNGLSLNEIMTHFEISKGTVGHWIRDVKLTEKQIKILKEKENIHRKISQKKACLVNSENFKVKRELVFKEGQDFINNFDIIPDDVVAAISLYWGEGRKSGSFMISNSDVKIILIFKKFLEKYWSFNQKDFKCSLSFYNNYYSQSEVENYWQEVLSLKPENFHKSQVNKKPQEKAGKKFGKLPYGVCSIGSAKKYDLIKMLGMIDALKARLLSK